MREPAAIAQQRDARRATCDAGAHSDRAAARRAEGDDYRLSATAPPTMTTLSSVTRG